MGVILDKQSDEDEWDTLYNEVCPDGATLDTAASMESCIKDDGSQKYFEFTGAISLVDLETSTIMGCSYEGTSDINTYNNFVLKPAEDSIAIRHKPCMFGSKYTIRIYTQKTTTFKNDSENSYVLLKIDGATVPETSGAKFVAYTFKDDNFLFTIIVPVSSPLVKALICPRFYKITIKVEEKRTDYLEDV